MRGVVLNFHSTRSPLATLLSTGLFETASQCPGVVTVRVKVALSDGWSKQGNMLRMCAVSPWEYR